MNKKSMRILEYNKILDILAGYAASEGAKKKIYHMKPLRERADIELHQQHTRDAYVRLETVGNISFSGVRNVLDLVHMLEIGSPISAEELTTIAGLLETADTVQGYGNEGEMDSLSEYFSMLVPLRDISGEIRRCILSSNEIADDASPELRSIRKKITTANANLHNQLDKIIKNANNRDMLMDALITSRNGRYCIPVKVEYKNAFPGMIHDRSSTGSTLFIEPMEVVNLNNTIRELQDDEHAEIENILEDLSRMAASASEDILEDYKLLVELDFIYAKAKYARAINASEPKFNEDGIIDIKRAIHPLLDPKTAVPIDLKLGEDYSLLIVTGPNTGGKTVSLKTLGLLTLMGQSGLHIPALPDSKLAIFDDVYADIGDEQSIEQNLSTFSSHMKNIIYIVTHANDKALCLFDEPGGGTDPAEGAALAIAVLRNLKDKGARVMATTHYTELKTFALSEPGVSNASCEFDIKTLQPTYRLMIGIPGASNAFAIAKRLGMPDEITENARQNMDDDQLSMEKILADMEESRRQMEKDKKDLFELKSKTAQLKQSLSDKEKNLDKKKEEILNNAREEARDIVADAKETADEAIRDYNKWLKNPSKADARSMENLRSDLRKKTNSYDVKEDKKAPKTSGHKTTDFHIGDRVRVLSLDTEGDIIETADSKGMLLVSMGILTARYPASDLLIIDDIPAKSKKEHNFRFSAAGSISTASNFKPEINLLGKTVDEAIAELEKYLDDALLVHAEKVRIVHGKGTGALRRGINDYLKKQSYVKSFRQGEFGEGDAGVTIVEL